MKKELLSIVLIAFFGLAITACGQSGTSDKEVEEIIEAEEMEAVDQELEEVTEELEAETKNLESEVDKLLEGI